MGTTEQIVEEDEYFLLPLDGREVTQCRVDSDFSLVSCEPTRDDVVIRVASFRLAGRSGDETLIDAEGPRDRLAPALTLYRDRIGHAKAWKDGRLEITFSSGRTLTASPDPDYESWEVSGPGSIMLVCVPGGGEPAIWG